MDSEQKKLIRDIRAELEGKCDFFADTFVMNEAIQISREKHIPLEKIWIWKEGVPDEDIIQGGIQKARENYYQHKKMLLENQIKVMRAELDIEFSDVVEFGVGLKDQKKNPARVPQPGEVPAKVPIVTEVIERLKCPNPLCKNGWSSYIGDTESDLTEVYTCEQCGWKFQGFYPTGPQKKVGIKKTTTRISKVKEVNVKADENIKDQIKKALEEHEKGLSLRGLSKAVNLSIEKTKRLVEELTTEEEVFKTEQDKIVLSE